MRMAPLELKLDEDDDDDDELPSGEPPDPLLGVCGCTWPAGGESNEPLPVGEPVDRAPPGEPDEADEARDELLSESAELPSASRSCWAPTGLASC